jgi:hypothetical protein
MEGKQSMFNRDQILRIRQTELRLLIDPDERRARDILDKFLPVYDKKVGTLEGKAFVKIDMDIIAPKIETDIDQRCRELLVELERASKCKKKQIDSYVLHIQGQRFPTEVLKLELNRALDRLLIQQITEREEPPPKREETKKAVVEEKDEDKLLFAKDPRPIEEVLGDVFLRRHTNPPPDQQVLQKQIASLKKVQQAKASQAGIVLATEIEEKEAEPAPSEILSISSGFAAMPKATRIQARRLRKANSLALKGVSGEKYCIACQVSPCPYKPPYEIDVLIEREHEIEKELDYIRTVPEDVEWINCFVAGSHKRGGSARMLKDDAVEELHKELVWVSRWKKMVVVDEELHLAYSVQDDYMVSVFILAFTLGSLAQYLSSWNWISETAYHNILAYIG